MPYEAYFKAASECLVIVGRDGRITEVNPQTERLFGFTKQELIGQPVEILIPERLRETHARHVTNYFKAPRTRAMGTGMRLLGQRKDGIEFPVEVSLTYAPGTVRGDLVVAAVIDITQRLALEREARRAESITSMGTFAAGVAHDLNNPLQIILSRVELILQTAQDSLPPEVREDLSVIQRHAERTSKIVAEFLRISRQRTRALAPLTLGRLIDDALLLMGDQLQSGKINVDARVDQELPPIIGDETALERVLINLLSNSRDAMPSGGTISIRAEKIEERPGWVRVVVADNGPGIAPEALTKIFDMLYTTKTDGTGLGLWLSRRIVQEHGGRIEVKSEAGVGAAFSIILPTGAESS